MTLAPRRARHALHTAFRTVDAADYSEIVTVDADRRAVLDLALDAGAGLAAVITVDASDGHASSARIYEIGRGRAQVGEISLPAYGSGEPAPECIAHMHISRRVFATMGAEGRTSRWRAS